MEISSLIPFLAIWGAILSTYLFFQGQSDRRIRKKERSLVELRIRFAPKSILQLKYIDNKILENKNIVNEISDRRLPNFPFCYEVVNKSDFSIQLVSGYVAVWNINDSEKTSIKNIGGVRMGFTNLEDVNKEPMSSITLKARMRANMTPIDQLNVATALDLMRYELLLLPIVNTATDGRFQGEGIAPYDIAPLCGHIPGFEEISKGRRN